MEAHADFQPKRSRDPVALLLSQAKTRVPDLVPIRHGRMLVSPFTFYRGAALIMAADLAGTPTPGLRTQLCGDAHLSNFGAYASPERRLVFDINDFDETLPGPFEWDVKRLAASFVVAGRRTDLAGSSTARQPWLPWRATAQQCEPSRRSRSSPSGMRTSKSSRPSPNTSPRSAHRQLKELKARIKATEGALAKARTRDSLQAIGKLSTVVDGRRQIISNPPLIVRLDDMIDLDPDEGA